MQIRGLDLLLIEEALDCFKHYATVEQSREVDRLLERINSSKKWDCAFTLNGDSYETL